MWFVSVAVLSRDPPFSRYVKIKEFAIYFSLIDEKKNTINLNWRSSMRYIFSEKYSSIKREARKSNSTT